MDLVFLSKSVQHLGNLNSLGDAKSVLPRSKLVMLNKPSKGSFKANQGKEDLEILEWKLCITLDLYNLQVLN